MTMRRRQDEGIDCTKNARLFHVAVLSLAFNNRLVKRKYQVQICISKTLICGCPDASLADLSAVLTRDSAGKVFIIGADYSEMGFIYYGNP